MPRTWVVKAAPIVKFAAGVLSVALPTAKAMAQIELGEATWKRIEAQVDAAKESLGSLADEVAKDLGDADAEKDIGSLEPDPQFRSSGAVLRQLHAVLKEQDPTFGGLEKVRNNRREALWVHPRFVEIYKPNPPVVRASEDGASSA